MAIVRFLSSLTLRSVLGGVCESAGLDAAKASPDFLAFAIVARFRDHSQRVGEALQTSVERGWSAVEIALSGDSWWQHVKGLLREREDHAFAQHIRRFLDAAEQPELTGKVKFRDACLAELKNARKQGLLTRAPEGDPLGRYVDPGSLLAAETQVLENIAGVLQEAGLGNLAYLLTLQARQGQPLLVLAVRYYFRRAVEEDPRLFHGLTFSQLDRIEQKQLEALGGLHEVLVRQGRRVDELLGNLQQQLAQTHEAVLDVQAELARQGTQNRDIYQCVLELQKRLDLMHREVRPRDSVSIRTEQERALVREVIARYRSLPEAQRARMPALLNAVGRLEVATGRFEAAQQDFGHVAELVQDDQARGEAKVNAYRTALERRDWDGALRELLAAIKLERRFAPFPIGKFRPRAILGAGGFGVAFLCRHEQLDVNVVVKTLVSEELDRDVDLIFKEAKTLYQLDHPAIVRLLDCGFTEPETKSRPYFVMNYFDGITLEEHVQRHGPLRVEALGEVARQMAEGLKAAHARGILHRDVKPANILIHCQENPTRAAAHSWSVKLIDFGLALSQRALTEALTLASPHTIVATSIAGTLEYAAPEQLGKLPGTKVGPAADVYGLAKTCCFALFETTEPTFHDWQRLPRGWAELLGDCLHRHPDKRPASMDKVLERLKALRAAPSEDGLHLAPELVLVEPAAPPVTPELSEWEGRLLRVLNATLRVVPSGALYVHPNIAPRKLSNARNGCGVPAREKVLGLIDCTTFGSGADAIVFGLEGVYYHNMGGNVPDPGFVGYAEFPRLNFVSSWLNCVMLGRTPSGVERYCNKSGATMTRDRLIVLLNQIKEDLLHPEVFEPLPTVQVGGALSLAERVHEILRAQLDLLQESSHGYYVQPHIPDRKLQGAAKGCGLPKDEEVLGLVDCTLFGSASDALVFGRRGFYYHNASGNEPDPGVVLYEEFPSLSFGMTWLNCVRLGDERYCNKSGSTLPRERLIAILEAIQREVMTYRGETPCAHS